MPFKPGVSGNPGGRPKSSEFKSALKEALKRADGDKTKLARIAENLVDEAVNGNVLAICEIAARVDGKVLQAAEQRP